jgi:hypothetical protein
MSSIKYLVLVHFAARLTRENLSQVAGGLATTIRRNLENCEAVLTSDAMVAMIGLSLAKPEDIFRSIAGDLRRGDNLSVLEVGAEVITSHPGLAAWQRHR